MAPRHWLLTLIAFVMLIAGMLGTPALAHKEHRNKAVAEQQAKAPLVAVARGQPAALTPVEAVNEEPVDRSRMPMMERLFDWLGRLHPIIVHFPIAFFPAALFTAVVGRRRPAFAEPVRFLIIAGGMIAPIAAMLGWLDASFNPATDDWLLQTHRWVGTGLGIGGLALALWSWKSPTASGGRAMILVLTAVTAAIAVQGWFGGAMVHGVDHLNW